MGQDTGSLAGWLQRELTNNGLKAFLDHRNGPQAGDDWPTVLRQAVWSCRVFIVLLSPQFFERQWPARELRIALQRSQQRPGSTADLSVIPVYCGWTRQQAANVLQAAALSASNSLRFQHPETRQVTESAFWQPVAGQSSQQPAARAWTQIQALNMLQPPNASRIFHEHYKLVEVEVVLEQVRAALRILGWRQFNLPTGKSLALTCIFVICCVLRPVCQNREC